MSRETDALARFGMAAKDLLETFVKPEPSSSDVWSAATKQTHYVIPRSTVDAIVKVMDDEAVGKVIPAALLKVLAPLRQHTNSG